MVNVSIVLPAYNAELTIGEAIQSIIDQTYSDWELIVINDGSSDDTENVVRTFSDKRIRYYANDSNRKLIYTLNRGLRLATGKYIARMDADDICYPDRLAKQVSFMNAHPSVIVCGTQIEYFGSKLTNYRKLRFPCENKELKSKLAISTCFAHPTVLIRRVVLEKNNVKYDDNFKNAEDYSLWIDLSPFGEFANLPEKLLKYRISDFQISQPNNPITEKSVLLCRKKYATMILPNKFADNLFKKSINLDTIKQVKVLTAEKGIWEACYLSLDVYNFKVLLYFFITFDFLRLGIHCFFRLLKRFLKGFDPIYYIC